MSKPRSRSTKTPAEPRSAAAGGREWYLVRHAVAAARGRQWPDDDLRPLTDDGIAKFRTAVAGLANLGLVVEDVLTSPLVRARQTAELLASGLPGHPPVKLVEALAPGHEPAEAVAEVRRVSRGRRVAVVGHEPGLGELAAFLIGTPHAIAFKKGGVCRVDLDPGAVRPAGALVWFATPKMLRRLGG